MPSGVLPRRLFLFLETSPRLGPLKDKLYGLNEPNHCNEVQTMSALVMEDRRPSGFRDSDAYKRLRAPGSIMARGHTARTPIGSRRELLRVLVVDDYRASADTMSRLVATWGHDARRAYDGTTGLALAAAYQPDVLLLDLIMSGVGGLALARQVRRQARVNNCLLIAVTGRTDAGHRLQCEEAGIDLFLIKPVDLSFLQTLLAVASECRLRTQRDIESYVIANSLRQRQEPNSLRRPRLPWHVLQGTAVS
jgi:CheY-like chemotaxis protein